MMYLNMNLNYIYINREYNEESDVYAFAKDVYSVNVIFVRELQPQNSLFNCIYIVYALVLIQSCFSKYIN